MEKTRVLVFVDYYEPGFKAGGPIRTLKNIFDVLKTEFDFYIITRNHDIADNKPYEFETGKWIPFNNAYILYLHENKLTNKKLKDIVEEVKPVTIYFNSFCSLHFSIKVLFWLRKCSVKKVLAPRGEFSSAALKIKWFRKWVFINVANWFNLYTDIFFHASSEFEKEDITAQINCKEVIVISDLVSNLQLQPKENYRKENNTLKLCYLGRISSVKNIEFCIESMAIAKDSKIILDIYGPIEDEKYFQKCRDLIKRKQLINQVQYKGIVEAFNVQQVIKKYDFLFLPSKGENFGHVIFESIAAGTPVIISKHTFWNRFENREPWGYYIPIDDSNFVADLLHQCCKMNNENYLKLSMCAFELAREVANSSNEKVAMKKLLN